MSFLKFALVIIISSSTIGCAKRAPEASLPSGAWYPINTHVNKATINSVKSDSIKKSDSDVSSKSVSVMELNKGNDNKVIKL